MKRVIDVSSWQHGGNRPIDWAAVAESGVEGAILKATQAPSYVNPWFRPDYVGARAAGLVVGAYYFGKPSLGNPEGQVEQFFSAIAGLDLRLGVWLDLEETGGLQSYELHNWAVSSLTALSASEHPAGLYTNLSTAEYVGGVEALPLLWLANPSSTPNPYRPVMVQWGQDRVPGIIGQVDLNRLESDRWVNAPHDGPGDGGDGGDGGNDVPAGDRPVLAVGAKGPAVRDAQTRLDYWGCRLTPDGIFGEATRLAVLDLQRAYTLTPDATIGPWTWARLDLIPVQSVILPAANQMSTTGRGGTGRPVVTAQWCLRAHGYGIAVDGKFGQLTDSMVRGWQSAKGLTVDGVVGPLTWATLLS